MVFPSNVNTLFQYSLSQVPNFYREYWSDQIKTFFISHDLWDVVEEGYKEQPLPVAMQGNCLKQYKEIVKKNETAFATFNKN